MDLWRKRLEDAGFVVYDEDPPHTMAGVDVGAPGGDRTALHIVELNPPSKEAVASIHAFQDALLTSIAKLRADFISYRTDRLMLMTVAQMRQLSEARKQEAERERKRAEEMMEKIAYPRRKESDDHKG